MFLLGLWRKSCWQIFATPRFCEALERGCQEQNAQEQPKTNGALHQLSRISQQVAGCFDQNSTLVDRLLEDLRPNLCQLVQLVNLLMANFADEHFALRAFIEIAEASGMHPVLVLDQALEYLVEEGNP